MSFDYIIVGAGPVGLTLAWLLAENTNHSVLVIDRESEIGGCHRVRRHNGLFTEHGPRVYSDIYLNMRQILERMRIPFRRIFTPYQFSNMGMGREVMGQLSFREIFWFALEYLKLIVNSENGIQTSVLEFMNRNNFSEQSKDKIDRVCRLTDGAGADRYTMLELLSAFDQHVFYRFYQPKLPNDEGLFALWKERLLDTGKVKFMLDTEVDKVTWGFNRVSGVSLRAGNNNKVEVSGRNVILAIPPDNALQIMGGYGWQHSDLLRFDRESQYDAYLPVIFHWDRPIEKSVWGFPDTPWGVVSIKLSDYMLFNDARSKAVISTCITLTDRPSPYTGKTANQSTREELVEEVFRQLKQVYGSLPQPTQMILSPGVYRREGRWQTQDASFVLAAQGGFFPQQENSKIKGLFWVGTHNGFSRYNFTSMESAMTNALVFFKRQFPQLGGKYQVLEPKSLSKILRFILIFIIVAVGAYYLTKRYKLREIAS